MRFATAIGAYEIDSAPGIFVNSMSDLFHEEVPTGFIDEVFAVMALATQHTFQVLTKRPERMRDYMLDPAMNNRFGMARARIFYAHSVCDCDVWMSGQQFLSLIHISTRPSARP